MQVNTTRATCLLFAIRHLLAVACEPSKVSTFVKIVGHDESGCSERGANKPPPGSQARPYRPAEVLQASRQLELLERARKTNWASSSSLQCELHLRRQLQVQAQVQL